MLKETSQYAYLSAGEGETRWVLGAFITYKERGGEGRNTVFEEIIPPQMTGPPHYHREQDETFYVLEGQYSFLIDGRTIDVGPGSFLHVPRGTVHAVRNVGAAPGKHLVSITPGPLVEFFDRVGIPVTDIQSFRIPAGPPPDMEKLVACARSHQIEIMGMEPPIAAI